ncbi:hypothetical protein G9U55_29320 [Streptomyces koyangensis]|uniref:Uncharacterized protein n=1 Tax=Streptomyces koyangensis TaxID=188770 RepID=A0ABX7E876_9ACTN|nr:hypothetical protein G9U55_29320 [Streptomyces koyangensis]
MPMRSAAWSGNEAGSHPSINVQFRNRHYPELSPPGTSVVYATYFCDIAPWRALDEGPEQATRRRGG